MSRDVPTGWRATTLGEMAEISGGSTPSKAEPGFWEGGTEPWVTPSDVTRLTVGNFVLDGRVSNFVTTKAVSETSLRMLPVGSVLMTSRATIGFPVINSVPMATNQGFANFLPSPNFSPEFLVQWLIHNRPTLEKMAGGSTFLEISKKSLRALRINLPPLAEQRRIAEILSSVDEAIRATQAVSEQLEKARTTALRRLFPLDLNELSEKFADWSVRPANQVTKAIIDCKNRTPPRTETGFAVVRTPNVRNGKFVRQGLHYTDADSFREWTQKGKPTSGDVLFTREAPFGEVCLTPSHMEVCLGQRMMLFRPDRDVLSPSYLLYALQSAGVQNDMFLKAGGSTVGHLRVNDVRNLPIPVAPHDVQESLERALSFIDDSISTNQAQRIKGLKSALMADLLTGRRRTSTNLLLAAE